MRPYHTEDQQYISEIKCIDFKLDFHCNVSPAESPRADFLLYCLLYTFTSPLK